MKQLLPLFLLLSTVFPALMNAQTTESLPVINPGFSAAVLTHRRFEIALFNQLSTDKAQITRVESIEEKPRITFLNHVIQAGYGIGRRNRFQVGATLRYSHYRYDPLSDRSPFQVLGKDDGTAYGSHQVHSFGAFVRGIPVSSLPELTVQAAVLLPGAYDVRSSAATGYLCPRGQLQVAFHKHVNPIFYFLATAGAEILFSSQIPVGDGHNLTLPVTVYPVLRLGRSGKTHLFGSVQYTGYFDRAYSGSSGNKGYRMEAGMGVQYFFNPDLNLYLQGQLPVVPGIRRGPYDTTTFRKRDAFSLSLGARYVI